MCQVTQLLGVLHGQEVFRHYFTSTVLGTELGTSGSLALCPLSHQERKPPAWHPPLVSSRIPQVSLIKAHTGTTKNWNPKRLHSNCFCEELKNKKLYCFLPSLPRVVHLCWDTAAHHSETMQINDTDAWLSAHPYTCPLEKIPPTLKHIHVGAGAHADLVKGQQTL